MKILNLNILKVILVTMLISLGAQSKAISASTLSLSSVQKIALENNLSLKQIQQEQLTADAQVSAAEAEQMPQLQLGYTLRHTNNALEALADNLNTRTTTTADFNPTVLNNPAASEIHITTLSAAVPLYTGGSLSAGIQAAKAVEKATSQNGTRLKQAIVYQAQVAFLNLQAASEALSIASKAALTAEKHYDTNLKLYKQDRIVESDFLSSEVNLNAYRTAKILAQTRFQKAKNGLFKILGINPENHDDSEIIFEPWKITSKDNIQINQNLTGLEKQAIENRIDLKALQNIAAAGHEKEKAVRGKNKPQINLIASQQWFDDNLGLESDSWRVALELKMDFDLRGKTQTKAQIAANQTQKLKYAATDKRLDIIKEVRNAYRDHEEAKELMLGASSNVKTAQHATRLIKERYGQGRTILIDLLQSEKALVDAKMSDLDAKLKMQTSKLAIDFATGLIELPSTVN